MTEPERYFTKSWIVIAGVVMGFVSAGMGAWLIAMAEPSMPLFTLIGAVGFATSALMFVLAWWSKRTPIVEIWPDRIEVKAAMFAAKRAQPWSAVTGFDEKSGVGRLVSGSGHLVIPLSTLSDADAAKVRASIARLRAPA